jgi:RimJ/RimL family protein N-acetyltransferase|tara:strand:- start:44 stop:439 length:396 start_codon:yes stop_codon:yes gene_type:complete
MELVNCDRQYWEFVRKLRINPKIQEGFFSYAEITQEQQEGYMSKNQGDYKICLVDGEPAGYVGLLKSHEITYCVSPNFQGKGVGTFMVKEYSLYWDSIDAFVKVDNIPSQKVFEKLGWEKQYYYKYKKNNA